MKKIKVLHYGLSDNCGGIENVVFSWFKNKPDDVVFDFINVISDGANTKYGSLFSPYEFYFKWNSTDGNDYQNKDGIDSINKEKKDK